MIDKRLVLDEIKLDKKYLKKDYTKVFLLTDKDYRIISNFNDYQIINTTLNLSKNEFKNSLFLIACFQEDIFLKELANIKINGGDYRSVEIDIKNFTSDYSHNTSYRFINTKCLKAIHYSFKEKNISITGRLMNSQILTFENICEGLDITRSIDGDYVEIGTYKGASALLALNYIKLQNSQKFAHFLDTFQGFNYLDSKISNDKRYYNTHILPKNFIFQIEDLLKDFDNYKLHKTNIVKDNLDKEIQKISLAHIDVDQEEATYHSLIKVSKKLSLNGIIMCEDPPGTPDLYGAKFAMEKFLSSVHARDKYIKIFKKNHYFLIKVK